VKSPGIVPNSQTIGLVTVKVRKLVDNTGDLAVIKLETHGINQLNRFDRLHELADLEDAILNLKRAVELTNDGHPTKPSRLSNLGSSQAIRFKHLGQLADLENAIANQQKAVELTDNGHPKKAALLANVAITQHTRFEYLGKLADLETIISNQREAVMLTDDAHPDKPKCLSSLGDSQQIRFKRLGELADLENAIAHYRKADELTGDKDTIKPSRLSNFGSAQQTRFEHLGELTDLDHAIANQRKAVEQTEDGHPNKPTYLSNLGNSQLTRFSHLGDLEYLENAILNQQKAVELTDDEHPNKPLYLSNLGGSQGARFERLAKLADVDNAILNLRRAVELTSIGCPDNLRYLSRLGNCQRHRYERLDQLDDLQMAISNQQISVELAHDDCPEKPGYYTNLGLSQLHRFERLGKHADIQNAISNLQHAVALTHAKNLNKRIRLSSLADCYAARFQSLGEFDDLESAISNQQKAIDVTDDDHPGKPAYLSNLGCSQGTRFKRLGNLSDLENAILNQKKAIELTDVSHPDRPIFLSCLGTSQHHRFERLGNMADLAGAVTSFKTAALSKTAYPRHALSAARRWAEVSHKCGDLPSALDGYRTALEILPKVAWLGLDTASHHDQLLRERSEELGSVAATCAIELGRLEEAVELLDLGRSVFWQQASLLRSNLETLKEEAPDLAKDLENVGQKLDAGHFSDTTKYTEQGGLRVNGREDIGKERRRLVSLWEDLVGKVRMLPKFRNFLKAIPFCQLREAATIGRIVITNVNLHRADALIFGAIGPIEHVPLPAINLQKLAGLTSNITLNRSGDTRATADARATQRRHHTANNLRNILRMVWHTILVPVCDRIDIPLKTASESYRPRIWWYPTGPLTFIPIHAAGPGDGAIDVSSMIISSYITTLGSLLQAQRASALALKGRLKLLAVSQPNTPGQSPIPQATPEALRVVETARSAGWPKEDIVHLHGSDATVERVLSALDTCSWVHFACHGSQDPTLGTKSAFAFENGLLELGQIASKKLSGKFAFLSACHAASGLKELPGEAMHLAAGLQFAGFPSVIATMWGIRDEDAPKMADHAYRYLFRNRLEGLDPSDAAMALNHAVLRLREDPEVTLDRWAPFVHFGI
jgi:hypothetical protein